MTRPVNDLSREQILLGDAYLNTLVPNPFVGLMPDAGATNTAATVQRRVLMRPLPQFGTINEQLVPIGYGNYSSIQVSWEKRLSQGVQLLVGYTGSRTTEALSPLNQGEPLYEQLTTMHRPHVLRLSGGWTTPSFSTRNWAMRHLLGGWMINTVTFFRSGVPVGMPDNVDLIGDPVLENPTTRPVVQYLHAHHRRRAAVLRERLRAAGVPDPRRERARHDRRPARRRHAGRAVLRRLLVLQEHPPERAG